MCYHKARHCLTAPSGLFVCECVYFNSWYTTICVCLCSWNQQAASAGWRREIVTSQSSAPASPPPAQLMLSRRTAAHATGGRGTATTGSVPAGRSTARGCGVQVKTPQTHHRRLTLCLKRQTFLIVSVLTVFRCWSCCWCLFLPTWKLQKDAVRPEMFKPVSNKRQNQPRWLHFYFSFKAFFDQFFVFLLTEINPVGRCSVAEAGSFLSHP